MRRMINNIYIYIYMKYSEKYYKELFKVDPKQDHRAFNDAILCKDVYYKLKEVYKENKKKNKKNKKNKKRLTKCKRKYKKWIGENRYKKRI